ncbi:MAG: metal ABC transporter permease, partial [Thermoplasmata archaeon]
SIKVIGIILVTALLVLPGLSALQLQLSFRQSTFAAVLIGIFSVVIGLFISAFYDVAASGIIVFTAAAVFLLTAIYKSLGSEPAGNEAGNDGNT